MSKQISSIPSQMQSVVLTAYGGTQNLDVVSRQVGKPAEGEVLVRVKASPINPSDLIFLAGKNPNARQLPAVPGFEGSGTVVASGGGEAADALVGKNVSFRSKVDKDGAWAEFAITDAERCIPLLESVSLTAGAMLQVNPLTAFMLVHKAQSEGHNCAIQNAAFSSLGKMVVRFARKRNLSLINIVRKEQHVEQLNAMGAEHVLNSERADFESALKELAKQRKATVAFDAIAGGASDQLLRAMPRRSELWVYGGLSGHPAQANPMSLIYEEKAVRGFWGPPAFYKLPKPDFDSAILEIQENLDSIFKSEVHETFPLQKVRGALEQYTRDMSKGKILLEIY